MMLSWMRPSGVLFAAVLVACAAEPTVTNAQGSMQIHGNCMTLCLNTCETTSGPARRQIPRPAVVRPAPVRPTVPSVVRTPLQQPNYAAPRPSLPTISNPVSAVAMPHPAPMPMPITMPSNQGVARAAAPTGPVHLPVAVSTTPMPHSPPTAMPMPDQKAAHAGSGSGMKPASTSVVYETSGNNTGGAAGGGNSTFTQSPCYMGSSNGSGAVVNIPCSSPSSGPQFSPAPLAAQAPATSAASSYLASAWNAISSVWNAAEPSAEALPPPPQTPPSKTPPPGKNGKACYLDNGKKGTARNWVPVDCSVPGAQSLPGVASRTPSSLATPTAKASPPIAAPATSGNWCDQRPEKECSVWRHYVRCEWQDFLNGLFGSVRSAECLTDPRFNPPNDPNSPPPGIDYRGS